MEKKMVYVLISQVGGMRFIHGVYSTEKAAQEWVERSSRAFKTGAEYYYQDHELDNLNA